ncbi:MAG: hypothetical protein ABIF77_18725 [bacterium]
MAKPTRQEGHLIVAAIRLLDYRLERSPRPEEVAEFLDKPAAALRVHLVELQDLGIVTLVESAFDTQVKIRDHLLLEELEADAAETNLSADLADFDRRKQAEAERMAQLFQDGDHERLQAERLRKMDDELGEFKRKKPPNPFGDV